MLKVPTEQRQTDSRGTSNGAPPLHPSWDPCRQNRAGTYPDPVGTEIGNSHRVAELLRPSTPAWQQQHIRERVVGTDHLQSEPQRSVYSSSLRPCLWRPHTRLHSSRVDRSADRRICNRGHAPLVPKPRVPSPVGSESIREPNKKHSSCTADLIIVTPRRGSAALPVFARHLAMAPAWRPSLCLRRLIERHCRQCQDDLAAAVIRHWSYTCASCWDWSRPPRSLRAAMPPFPRKLGRARHNAPPSSASGPARRGRAPSPHS
jgi:hypothetical protein